MRLLAIQTLSFIINKWDYSYQDILTPSGKVLFYIPWLINSILTQVFLFGIFPAVMTYVYVMDLLEPFMKILEEFRKSFS